MSNKFKAGVRCNNEMGWYTVLSEPVNYKMTVKYDTGEVKMLISSMEAVNLRLGKNLNSTIKRDEDYYIALGFLASSSFILVQMPEVKALDYMEEYQKNTGKYLNDNYLEGFQIVKAWGTQMRIIFDKRIFDCIPSLNFKTLAIEKSSNNQNTCQINNNDWVNELINMGFEVGSSHNGEKIISKIPEKFHTAFQIGYEFAKEFTIEVKKPIFFPAKAA